MDTISHTTSEKCSSCGKEWKQIWHVIHGEAPRSGMIYDCVDCYRKRTRLTGNVSCLRCDSKDPPIATFTIEAPEIGRCQRSTVGLCNPCLLFIMEGMTAKIMEIWNGKEEAEVCIVRNDNQP